MVGFFNISLINKMSYLELYSEQVSIVLERKNLIFVGGILFTSILLLFFCFYQYRTDKKRQIENLEKIVEKIEASK